MSPEIWKDVVGYEGFYKVSSKGKIISVARYKKNHSKLQSVEEKEISQYLNPKNGYVYVYLCKNGEYKNKRLHRVVAEAFLPNEEGYKQINHKDGVRSNNSVDNLEWCDKSYNMKHAIALGLKKDGFKKGSENISAKLSDEDVEWIRSHYKYRDKEFGISKIAKKFNVHRATIGRIINNHSWKK